MEPSVIQCIGNTPLLELKSFSGTARLLAKAEFLNPGGSVKDRPALFMLRQAFQSGKLAPGGTVIEPTSGNTGIALAMLGISWGCKVIIVMPDSMSPERRALITAYGAQLELTPGSQGMAGAIRRARALAEAIPGSFIPDQFSNPANPQAHYETTGPEIWAQAHGHVDIFVAGAGTGGTVTGVGRFLKERDPKVRVVAVEPEGSPVLSGGSPGSHRIQGIGAGFIPAVLDLDLVDEVLTVSDSQAKNAMGQLRDAEGIFTGISAGAALHAATLLAGRQENAGKTIVTVLPDTGTRYLSLFTHQ